MDLLIRGGYDGGQRDMHTFTYFRPLLQGLSESSTESLANPEDTQVRLTLASPIKSGLNIAVNTGVLLAKWYFR